MSAELFIGFAILVILAGAAWRSQNSRLANRLFGSEHQLRYVHNRWVVEAQVRNRRVKYTTGGMGLLPALTYLMLEAPVRMELSVVGDELTWEIPESVRSAVDSLRRRDGFKRLDVLRAGSSFAGAAGRVSWLHPGDGILLRRYTKNGGNAVAVTRDLELLQSIAESLAP